MKNAPKGSKKNPRDPELPDVAPDATAEMRYTQRRLRSFYTGRFNRRHKLFGHLFSGRYKASVVDGSSTGYLKTVCDHVHLGQMKERIGAEHYGEERQETAEAHAEGIVAEELKRRGWSDEELGRRAKGDAQKVSIAVRVRRDTAMTVKWIADRLQMGAPGYVNHLLYCRRKTKEK